jgi:Domain of unknown function (DUF4091)/Family of unknown function (DUF6067)
MYSDALGKGRQMVRKSRRSSAFRAILSSTLLLLPFNSFASNISAVWANDGGDKVTQDELRATLHKENLTGKVINRTWNGQTITLSGARNEVISFNLVLEAAQATANNVTVTFDTLTGPNGSVIHSSPAEGNSVFTWVDRPIELFHLRYLQIKGLSFFGYGKGDERQIPVRFQRPWTGNGMGQGTWLDRPDHDKFYPDIMVPLQLVKQFDIASGHNQSIWADIYIPKSAATGVYSGNVIVQEAGVPAYTIPVQLAVYNFALPDTPSAKTMGPLSTMDIMQRYVAGAGGYVNWQTPAGQRVQTITDRYFELFHRHKIGVVGENECNNFDYHPCDSAVPRLNGSLFTAQNGYDGPGVAVGTGIYSIGTYGNWNWRGGDEATMWQHADSWVNWFTANSPGTEYFLFLADEPTPSATAQVEKWAEWIKQDPGPGKQLLSMVTHHPVLARSDMPSVDIAVMIAAIGLCPGNKPPCDASAVTQAAADFYLTTPGKQLWAYNDSRPGVASSEIEDDGIAFRQIAWAQYKKHIQGWFYWYLNPDLPKDWFQTPITWGSVQFYSPVVGEYGNNGKSNGNGLLVYPGTDLYHPSDSYGVDGPFASLRLKEWRRGIQDVDYLTLAAQINPTATQAIVNSVVPQVLWEYHTTDPSYYIGPISWSVDPDVWEAARAQLAQIISPHP